MLKPTFLLIAFLVLAQYNVSGQTLNRAKQQGFKNSVALSPLAMTALEGRTYFGPGLSYERFLDRSGYFSADIALFGGKIGLQKEKGQLYTVSPALRCHPLGNSRRLDVSCGLRLLAGKEGFSYRETQSLEWSNVIGLMFELNLDLHIKKQGLVGLYASMGQYRDSGQQNRGDVATNPPGAAFLLGIKVGGRF